MNRIGNVMIEYKKTILIVDDTPTNIDILLELFGNQYDVLVALDGPSALEIAEKEKIDLILLDIMMPHMDGYEVCRILKSQSQTEDIPVIFLTAKVDEDSIEKAYEIGGIDYISKPFKPRELLARIKTQLEMRSLLEYLEYIAFYDEMTGIYNRRKFFELALEAFDKSKTDLYGIMLDIDKFKQVNDTYGHATGDKVIKAVAQCISENIHKNAIFGRIGGEEFAVVCHVKSQEEIMSCMEDVRKKIERLEIIADDTTVVKCTISEGIFKATEAIKSLDELLKEADKALYEAKGTGRNKAIFR
jgi:two-component system glycerol uptake and utilization response regulator